MEPILRTEHLTFTYPGEERPTLGDLSLEIARGSFVAVLGHNGSGKSTLAKHFNAILLPTGGKVYVDGMDTSDESLLVDIRRTVGMVFQKPNPFPMSIYDNIAFSRPGATREEVIAAAKAAKIHNFIMGLPDGYDTVLGEGGGSLSGGEKQRLIHVEWEEDLEEKNYDVDLVVHSNDRSYLLSDIVTVVSQCKAKLNKVDSKVNEDGITATTKLTVGVNDAEHLRTLIANLRKVNSVNDVERVIH